MGIHILLIKSNVFGRRARPGNNDHKIYVDTFFLVHVVHVIYSFTYSTSIKVGLIIFKNKQKR